MSQDLWILDDEPIEVSFDTKGYSWFKATSGGLGDPSEAFLRLIAVKQDEQIVIQTIPDLAGRVIIRSPEEALEFVRLFTSVATHYLFPDSQYLEAREADNGPGAGEYSKTYGEEMNLKPPVARHEGDVFLLDRTLVNRKGKLLRGKEQVSRDGGYELLEAVVIDERTPVIYPLYQ